MGQFLAIVGRSRFTRILVTTDNSRTFHAGVQAKLMKYSGGLQAFATTNRLEFAVVGRGCTPKDEDAIFARTPHEIENRYDCAGDLVPIAVEYRRIAGRSAGDVEEIPWVEPTRVRVRFEDIMIFRDGSLGRDTWTLQVTCKVNGTTIVDGETIPGWEMKRDIGDNEIKGDKGPRGDENYNMYSLGWSREFEIVDGDEVSCGISGMALDDHKAVEYDEFRLTVRRGASVSDRVGASGSATEYWATYSVLME